MKRKDLIDILVNAEYRFAYSMPKLPHYYTLENEWGDKELFSKVAEFVIKNGQVEPFFSKQYIYFYHGGFKYWVMKIRDGSGIINRADAK